MNEPDLHISFAGLSLKNPVMTASGTFAARESGAFYDISRLGAVITKGVAAEAWAGNPTPRIAETYGGMLNAVGLQNPGAAAYIENELSYLANFDVPVIANLAGHSVEEYVAVTELLNETNVAMYELNISCPNVKEGGIGFGTDPRMAARVTEAVKRAAKKPVMVKLTPNVTDITAIARAVEDAGADALSLINTLLGMRIDLKTKRPLLANGTGGLSGPTVKPVAIRMVYQVRRAVKLPILGLGGIMTGEDAAEFLLAGADAVAVGTAALINRTAPVDVLEGLAAFMRREGYESIAALKAAFQGE